MKPKTIISITILAAIVVVIAFVLTRNKKEIDQKALAVPARVSAMPVKVAIVENRALDNSITLTGFFDARRTLPLIAEAQGSIIDLKIKEGQQISAGQIVARIDPTSIRSNLATAQATFNNAVKNEERFKRLVQAGAISQKQYEDIALNVDNARANVEGIQQQMKYTIIHSPMSGIVSEVKVEKGSFATPGMQLGNVIDISRLKMIVLVDEIDVIKLRSGQPVSVTTDVYPGQVFKGKISLIGVQADAARKYNVEIEVVNNSSQPLKAGMFGTAKFNQGQQQANKLFIPRSSIIGSIEDAQVFILNDADSTVTLKKIQAQNQTGDAVIVLSGIQENDQVVVSGQINLQTGQKVRVVSNITDKK